MSYYKAIYRFGGANYNVIKHCDHDICTKYLNLGYSLILSTVLATIGGFDIANQFTPNFFYCSLVSLLWGLAVFSFDYFLINGGSTKGAFKYIRIPVGFANVFITITALFVLLNQSTIDSKIRLTNADKITFYDSIYLKAKEARYDGVKKMKDSIIVYHQKNCVPEALNGHPGILYELKHSLCDTTYAQIARETVKLDSTEKTYYTAYMTKKNALQNITNNDFFAKAKMLPDILRTNKLILFLAVCLFIFLGYIELQSILMKFSIDPNDEYHTILRKYIEQRRGLLNSKMEQEIGIEKNSLLLSEKIMKEKHEKSKFDADMEYADSKALREFEVISKIEIFRNKGYNTTANDLEKIWKQYTFIDSSLYSDTPIIFKSTQSMRLQLEEIKKLSNSENLAENIFKWIETNIAYDTEHSKEHYRTAVETYNEKRGICGELSVLYMTFLRAVNIDCVFCEVTKDLEGKEVAHACIMIKTGDKSHLSDLAYHSFNIEHLEFRQITDDDLKSKYDNWNQ